MGYRNPVTIQRLARFFDRLPRRLDTVQFCAGRTLSTFRYQLYFIAQCQRLHAAHLQRQSGPMKQSLKNMFSSNKTPAQPFTLLSTRPRPRLGFSTRIGAGGVIYCHLFSHLSYPVINYICISSSKLYSSRSFWSVQIDSPLQ